MSDLIYFEGFETCGSATGSATASTTIDDIMDRVALSFSSGSADPYLWPNEAANGYALRPNIGRETYISLPVPGLAGLHLTPLAPIYTIGFRVRFQDTLINNDVLRYRLTNRLTGVNASNSSGPGIFVSSAGALQFRYGSNVLGQSSTGAIIPSAWHYIELSLRPSILSDGLFGTAQVDGIPPEDTSGSYPLPITNCVCYRAVWEAGESYDTGEEVRWKGRAYTSLADSNVGNDPSTSPGSWTDDGLEDDPGNLLTNPGNLAYFYILEDPDQKIRSYVTAQNTPATNLTNTGFWDYTGGDYEPSLGDTVVFGDNPYWELRLDGALVAQGYTPIAPPGTTGWEIRDLMLVGPLGMSNSTGEYITFDDIYVTVNGNQLGTGFLGQCIVESLRPVEDVQQEWVTSSGSDHFATVGTNGNNTLTYVQAPTSDRQDRFLHQTSSNKGTIYGVQMEAQVVNTTGGSPTLEVSIGPASEITEEFVIENTGSTDLYKFFTIEKPGGGEWDFDALNEMITGLKSSGL